jgi:multicomponent K+:H+ antiporter subunit E
LPFPLLSLIIFILWIGLAPAPTPGQALLGGIIALVMPHLTRNFWPNAPRIRKPLAGMRLVGVVLFDIVTANVEVARQVIGPTRKLRPGFLAVPLDIDDPFIATVFGSIISLTPGTVSCDIDRKRKVVLVHALNIDDPHASVTRMKARYEAPLKEVFGC